MVPGITLLRRCRDRSSRLTRRRVRALTVALSRVIIKETPVIDHLHTGVAYRAGGIGGHIVTYLLKHITAEISMLSNYAEKLSGDGKKRYIDKLSLINRVDPYTLTSSCLKSDTLPKIEMPDMFNYLVLGRPTSSLPIHRTNLSLKAF